MRKLLPPLLVLLLLAAMVLGAQWLNYQIFTVAIFGWIGLGVSVLGALLSIAAKHQFKSAATNVNTFDPPTRLVTSGLFRFSRNPMYLGLTLLLLGAALMLNSAFALLGPILFFAASSFWYIPFEEDAARSQFGDDYQRYCASVRRWL